MFGYKPGTSFVSICYTIKEDLPMTDVVKFHHAGVFSDQEFVVMGDYLNHDGGPVVVRFFHRRWWFAPWRVKELIVAHQGRDITTFLCRREDVVIVMQDTGPK